MKKNKYVEANSSELKNSSGKKGANSVRVFQKPGMSSETEGVVSLREKMSRKDEPVEEVKPEKEIKPEKAETKPEKAEPTEAVSGKEADAAKQKESGIKAAARKRAAAKQKKADEESGSKRKGSSKSKDKKTENTEAESAKDGKKKPSKALLSGVLTALLLVLIGAACVGIYYVSLVSSIRVNGCKRYTESQIIDASGLYTGKLILTYDTAAAAKKLEEDPYIDVLSVKKVFPDEIVIDIAERDEYMAIVTGNGTYCITDRKGFILYAGRRENIDGLLPVYGLGTMGFSTGTYIDADKSKLRPYVLMELLDAFGERDGEIASVDLTIPAGLKLTTADGYTVMLGDSVDIAEKAERMFSALDKARASGSDNRILYINSSGTADLSGGAGATAAPTASPSPTEAPTVNPDGTAEAGLTEEPTETDSPEATEAAEATEPAEATESAEATETAEQP